MAKSFASKLSVETLDAWSAGRFVNWFDCAAALERAGYTKARAEKLLRSRVTRWAADQFETETHQPDADDLMAFIAMQPSACRSELGFCAA